MSLCRRALSLVSLCLLIAASSSLIAACNSSEDWRHSLPPPVEHDLDRIRERDTLSVLTTYNSTSYFLYRGQPMGFEYELLKAFAEDQEVHLKMTVLSSRDSIYQMLNRGYGDVVADRVVPMAADSAHIAFTEALYETPPVLVQRDADVDPDSILPEAVDTVVEKAIEDEDEPESAIAAIVGADTVEALEVRARLIRRPAELAGEEVTLPNRSEYTSFLIEVEDTLTGDIEVVEVDTASSYEKVIQYVAAGEYDLTVSPRNLARLSEDYFSNIHIQPALGAPHRVAWAVRTNAPELKEALDEWIEEHRDEGLFRALYEKYFIDREGYRNRTDSHYLTGRTGRLSEFDDLLKIHAREIGWDWRLLASQTYQESRFEPQARSWAGAAGLLQLMPSTAREFGVANVYDPEENVAGGVRFIQWLSAYWEPKIEDENERLKFILASYNTGQGHVEDARRLAAKNGYDDRVWADVAYWLLQKSKRQVYQDPVVRFGFCRGLEPVAYVSYILDRFENYRQFVDLTAGEMDRTPMGAVGTSRARESFGLLQDPFVRIHLRLRTFSQSNGSGSACHLDAPNLTVDADRHGHRKRQFIRCLPAQTESRSLPLGAQARQPFLSKIDVEEPVQLLAGDGLGRDLHVAGAHESACTPGFLRG